MGRWARAAAVTAGLLVVLAAPALAHGGGGSDATNFRSAVLRVIGEDTGDAERTPAADVPGLSWRVLAGDALLAVDNRTGREVAVPGYEGEPYLRIGPDGVFENRNSPATYQNNDRYAQSTVPTHASADAAAD